jgi:hypothetical protein
MNLTYPHLVRQPLLRESEGPTIEAVGIQYAIGDP